MVGIGGLGIDPSKKEMKVNQVLDARKRKLVRNVYAYIPEAEAEEIVVHPLALKKYICS